jgi:hypothetical protein
LFPLRARRDGKSVTACIKTASAAALATYLSEADGNAVAMEIPVILKSFRTTIGGAGETIPRRAGRAFSSLAGERVQRRFGGPAGTKPRIRK